MSTYVFLWHHPTPPLWSVFKAMARPKGAKTGSKPTNALPRPFKPAPDSLEPFTKSLSPIYAYITHVDLKPRDFKRKIFLVPVAMNIAVTLLFAWRVSYIGPYYLQLIATALGFTNETTLVAADLSWSELSGTVLRRGFTFMLDLCLAIFVWPWPVEFVFARGGSPVKWRWAVGFRDKEIYVRRSRAWYAALGDLVDNDEARSLLLSQARIATSPMLQQQKTGYLTMNGEWDLDWGAMVSATRLVDEKTIALDAFRTLVLVHLKDHGWVVADQRIEQNAAEEERRGQVFAFRDALAAVGKEDLFFRWIEMIQFEASQPGGFGPEKQAEAATRVRDLFQEQGIDFDAFWKETVGTEGLAGM
jgi:hypothetical protein